MIERITLDVSLAVQSPFIFPGLASGLLGLDVTQLRDETRRPVLPAAQMQGLLREALSDISDIVPDVFGVDEVSRMFGQPSAKAEEDEERDRPDRGCVLTADLVAHNAPQMPGETTRVQIDDDTGAAKTGHLQMIELVAPFGEIVIFTGQIVVFWAAGNAERVRRAFDLGLRLIPAVGAFKSAGFGALVAEQSSVKLKATKKLVLPTVSRDEGDRIGLAVTFDRPILVDARRVVDNAFVGASIVPGAVFKGALARKLALTVGDAATDDAAFGSALSALLISHAFPEDAAGQPAGEALPLSIVAVKDGEELKVGEAMRIERPESERLDTIRGALIDGKAASFAWDWKPDWFDKERADRPDFTEPAYLPRTHTAIGEGGVAAEHLLFTTIARSVQWQGDPSRDRRFLMNVDLRGVPPDQREKARTLVAMMCEGLDGIGRTGATASFKRWPDGDSPPEPRPVLGHSDLFAVVLRTAAVLTDPRTEASADIAYADYWENAAAPGSKLVDFCASQRLAGGYLATRRRPWGRAYHPFVVTEPGAVFVLRGSIGDRLADLVRTGLPLPRFAGRDQALDWRTCPYVPENGYGAFRADHLGDPVTFGRTLVVCHV